jgi:hypothetical protein
MKIIIIVALLFTYNSAIAQTVVIAGQSNAVRLMRYSSIFADAVIDCTKPATAIKEFQFSLDQTSLFGKCFLGFNHKKIDAIIFWQGESDSFDNALAANWAASSSRFIDDLRRYIGDPRTPVIMIEMRPNGCATCNRVNWNIIRRAQVNFMLAYKIDSANYQFDELHNAGMHLTDKGYSDMAIDINEMFNKILNGS